MMKRSIPILCIAILAAPLFADAPMRCSKLVAETTAKAKLPTFSATEVLDVNLVVQFVPGHAKQLAQGDHSIEMRFFGPQGFLYESRIVPLTSDPAQASTSKQVAGYRRPLARKLVTPSKSGKELEVRVPLAVAATTIVSSSMYGTWRAEAYLDDLSEPCTAPATFVITQ